MPSNKIAGKKVASTTSTMPSKSGKATRIVGKKVTPSSKPKTQSDSRALVVAKPAPLAGRYAEKAAEFELYEKEQEEAIRGWSKRLAATRFNVIQVHEQFRNLMLGFLSEAYAVYVEAESSEFNDDLYAELRYKLKEEGVKTQSNTPNAGLIVRYICGPEVKTKSVSDYSKVLDGALQNKISPSDFENWVNEKTMTKVIAEQRAHESKKESYAERLKRARLVVLRALQARETRPIISQKTTAWDAERLLGRDGMWIAIGNATRRFDRESFYADINLLMMLSPCVDLEIHIINHLAKPIVSNVEVYEQLIDEHEERVWGEELWEKIISAGEEAIKKSNQWWAERQQAARFESQSEFEAFRKKSKKKK
jgi:hypothetical protein